jgi:phage shock protein C
LQHVVQIPNCRVADVARIANPALRSAGNALKRKALVIWHGSCSVLSNAFAREFKKMSAQENQVALPLRSHTILGVCEAIGEDFGFNPVFLRVPLAASVIWNPVVALGTYFALGALVLASRLLFPKAKTAQVVSKQREANNEQVELAKAA